MLLVWDTEKVVSNVVRGRVSYPIKYAARTKDLTQTVARNSGFLCYASRRRCTATHKIAWLAHVEL